MGRAIVLLVSLAVRVLAADDGRMEEVAGLRFAVPEGWERVEATSPVRAAQFRIPRAGRKQEDGELILLQYGVRKGGTALDFAQRWYAQFTQPDGRPKEAASLTRRSVNGLTVEVIDLAGTYRPAMGPMEHRVKPNWRLLGAVVEDGDRGPWYWRAVGPAETMEKAKAGFDALIGTLEVRR